MSTQVKVTIHSNKINAERDSIYYSVELNDENKYTNHFYGILLDNSRLRYSNIDRNEVFPVKRISDNKIIHCQYNQFSEFTTVSDGESETIVWGDVEGDINNQEDLINLVNSSGGNLTTGVGVPGETPDNPKSIYINEENSDLYKWNPETESWDLKINGVTSTFGIVEENPTDAPEESEPWAVLNINTGLLWYYNGEAWVSQVSKNLQELFDENEGKAVEGYNIINVVDQKLNFNGGASGEFGFYGAVGDIFSNSTSTGVTTKGRGQLSFNKTGPNILQNEGNNDGLQILGDAGPISINSQGSSINLSGAGAVVQSGGASATFGSGSLAISTSNSFNVQGSNNESILLQTGIATIEAPSRIILRRGEEGDGSSIVVDGIIDIKSVGNTNISTNGSPIALLVKDSDDEYTSGQLSVWGNYGVKISDSYYLPTSDGSAGQVITTDGGGVTEWVDMPSPSQLELVDGAGTNKGWRLLGQSAFKGDPGNNSVDLGKAQSGIRGARGDSSVVGGGINNSASASNSVVGGGSNNSATASNSVVSGGHNNTASGDSSVVSGGYNNNAIGDKSVVSGGLNNIANGTNSIVAGGINNVANEYSSFVIGRYSTGGNVETTWISGSPIFKVGNGVNTSNRSNAYVLNNDGTSIQSGIASYEGDYSENFTDRSLVDKGYVDNKVSEVTWQNIEGKPAFVAEGIDAAAARTALGLGTAATTDSSAYATAAQGALADTSLQPSDASDVSDAGKIVKYSNIGAVNTAMAQFPENAVNLQLLNLRLSEAQRSAINALVSPTTDYADMTEATAAIKAVIDALQAV